MSVFATTLVMSTQCYITSDPCYSQRNESTPTGAVNIFFHVNVEPKSRFTLRTLQVQVIRTVLVFPRKLFPFIVAMSSTIVWRGNRIGGSSNRDAFSNATQAFLGSPSTRIPDSKVTRHLDPCISGSAYAGWGGALFSIFRRNICEERSRFENGNLFAFSFRPRKDIGLKAVSSYLDVPSRV